MERTEGPVVIVDADSRSREFYSQVIQTIDVQNDIRFFEDGRQLLDYLYTTSEKPFIVLSETSLPVMSGLELKEIINNDKYLREKAIPFIFITSDTGAATIRKAHQLNVQGYFEKPHDLIYVELLMVRIFEYWELCKHINNT